MPVDLGNIRGFVFHKPCLGGLIIFFKSCHEIALLTVEEASVVLQSSDF